MNRICTTLAALAATLVGALGCSDESDGGLPAGGAGGSSGTSQGGAAGAGGAGGAGDEGTSCAEPIELELGVNAAGGEHFQHDGVIAFAGDRDYFRIEAQAGQWLAMSTSANELGDPAGLDTVLTLYDETGSTQIAHNDDRWGPDSQIVHRFTTAGTYCLELGEHGDVSGGMLRGGEYQLYVVPVDPEAYDDWNLDQEPNDDSSTAQTPSAVLFAERFLFTRVAGALDQAADVDYYRIPLDSHSVGVHLDFVPPGPTGSGSSLRPGLVRILRDDGSGAVVAALDLQPDGAGLVIAAPVDPAQPYLLEIPRPASAPLGDNDFYVFRSWAAWNLINESEPNDQPTAGGSASPHQFIDGLSVAYAAGQLPAGDVDWFGFHATAGTLIRVACDSWRSGSGLRDATFALFPPACANCAAPAAEPLAEQTETATVGVYWTDAEYLQPSLPPLTAPLTGDHFLRITATQYDPAVESTLYSCRLEFEE